MIWTYTIVIGRQFALSDRREKMHLADKYVTIRTTEIPNRAFGCKVSIDLASASSSHPCGS